jgi:hypothetical protein
MTKQAVIYRQGDVWITRITRREFDEQARARFGGLTPELKADSEKGLILAEGEATGHHHRIAEAKRVRLRPSRAKGIVRLLEVKPGEPVELVHEEHSTIPIPPGYYEVRIQREYEPSLASKSRRVYD